MPKKEKWITFQNLHLMSKLFKIFENEMEAVSQIAAPKFTYLISSEPPELPYIGIIPEPMLKI